MRRDLIYKEESYRIIGCCFEAFNVLGAGQKEKVYQSALEKELRDKNINLESQLYVPLTIKDELVGKYYLDLLVDNKIAVELKVGDHFSTKDIEQLFSYLKSKNLLLGLLIHFTSKGVRYKRIVNLR